MNAFLPDTILRKLEEELESLKKEPIDKKMLAEKSIGLCQLAFLELKGYVLQNNFKDTDKEIIFFKTVKPQVFSKLIFYNELLKIENYKLLTHRKLMLNILNDEIRKIHRFIKSNKDFYHYYSTNQTSLDENYFVRNDKYIFTGNNNLQYLTDPQFATLRDETVAYILAYEQLGKYLDEEVYLLKSNQKLWQTFQPKRLSLKLTWTASKVALIELIYALHSSHCINNGRVHINELIEYFELMFDVKLYKSYRAFIDIKDRKREKARFLVELQKAFINRLDDLDSLN